MTKKTKIFTFRIFLFVVFFKVLFFNTITSFAEESFSSWLTSYKKFALSKGVSKKTLDLVLSDVRFLNQVIKYDRKQPEFFEDTNTYVSKRASLSRSNKAKNLYQKNKDLFNEVEKTFFVEKEILLALWGIETNFGKHVGKMDIISSLATLSYDKRRRDFFSSELLILLKLIDDKLLDHTTLFGSWAGAFGNFQFMPSTIKNYAIDYDGNNKIELKTSLEDSLASAANYIRKIGWKKNEPCFYKVKTTKEIKNKYINTSARKINNRLKVSKWKKKGIIIENINMSNQNLKAALVMPDGKPDTPTFLVFQNYEKILKWNRSLRFGISVCTLANMINNEIK